MLCCCTKVAETTWLCDVLSESSNKAICHLLYHSGYVWFELKFFKKLFRSANFASMGQTKVFLTFSAVIFDLVKHWRFDCSMSTDPKQAKRFFLFRGHVRASEKEKEGLRRLRNFGQEEECRAPVPLNGGAVWTQGQSGEACL